MDTGRLVPPGTASLSICFGWASNRAPGTPHDLDWDLLVKPANMRPSTPNEDYILLKPAKTVGTYKEYTMPVTFGQTDAFYQKGSNWVFIIRQTGIDTIYGVAEYEHAFKLEVLAHKDSKYV
jgi:hypothetical protein